MENKEKKVLLQISNLKQYFPVGKGRFVRANDGITLDIYEGETFGLVGESGCGKSTLGRSILQLYKQTDGRTMYFGRSIDELAPKYAHDTFNSLVKRREQMKVKREKYAAFRAEYDKLEGAERYAKHEEMVRLRKEANDAMLDVATLIGGLFAHPDLAKVEKAFVEQYKIYRIPESFTKEVDGKKVVITPTDFYNYISRPIETEDGRRMTGYQHALSKLTDEQYLNREILDAWLMFTGGTYKDLIDMAVKEDKVRQLRVKSKEQRSTKTVKVIKTPASKSSIDDIVL